MLYVETIKHGYATLQVCKESLKGLKTMVNYAAENYYDTNLEYGVPVSAEHRESYVKDLQSKLLTISSTTFMMSETDIKVLRTIIGELFDRDIEGITQELQEELFDDFHEYDFNTMFILNR